MFRKKINAKHGIAWIINRYCSRTSRSPNLSLKIPLPCPMKQKRKILYTATNNSKKKSHIPKKNENKKIGPKIKISEKNPKLGGALKLNLINKKHQKASKGLLKRSLFPKKILRELNRTYRKKSSMNKQDDTRPWKIMTR